MTKGSVVTLGTFDGVHLGHRSILKRAVELAREKGFVPAALTFEFPPRLYFSPVKGPYLLSTVEEKRELLKGCGIRKVRFFRFGRKLANLSAEKFFDGTVKRDGARAVVVGYNFAFGKGREGSPDFLKRLGRARGVRIEIVPAFRRGGKPVSSGRIREFLLAGDLSSANRLLGSPYFVLAKVGRGRGLGGKIGFPTANLEVSPLKIVPRGVFAVKATLPGGKVKPAVCNVGVRPTVSKGASVSVEVHIPGFRGNLYGKTLKVRFLKKLREEKRFSGVEALKAQIGRDARRALEVIHRLKGSG